MRAKMAASSSTAAACTSALKKIQDLLSEQKVVSSLKSLRLCFNII